VTCTGKKDVKNAAHTVAIKNCSAKIAIFYNSGRGGDTEKNFKIDSKKKLMSRKK